ncbi:MAG: hypothetical protein IJ681_00215 [Bacteroidales bacterium]|nr:hypothetical protein [Bacteroidales bacterium]
MEDKKTNRGGYREGCGRKKGVRFTDRTAIFTKRISPEEKIYLEKCLQEYRNRNKQKNRGGVFLLPLLSFS